MRGRGRALLRLLVPLGAGWVLWFLSLLKRTRFLRLLVSIQIGFIRAKKLRMAPAAGGAGRRDQAGAAVAM